MEFFTEKNGKYHAQQLVGNTLKSPLIRLVLTLLPLGIIAAVYFLSPAGENGIEDKTPLLIGGGMVIFANLISFVVRSAGLGSALVVDQMNGTVSFRKPGGNRSSVPIGSLERIVINTIPGKASILCFQRNDGKRHVLMYAKDSMRMRQLADELSTLTSLTVSEEIKDAVQA